MNVVALVMAGGRGSRMKLSEEKPLIKVNGKPMIKHVIDALKGSRRVNDIIVSVSLHTPKTAQEVNTLSIKVIETPGEGYVSDIQYAVKKLQLGKVLVISADLPFITSNIIDCIVKHYEGCGKPALAVMVPKETCERMGLSPEYVFNINGRIVTPAGVNIIDGSRIDDTRIEEETLILDCAELITNINTNEDLKVARETLYKSTSKRRLPI